MANWKAEYLETRTLRLRERRLEKCLIIGNSLAADSTIQAINTELQSLNSVRLQKVLRYARAQAAAQVARHHEFLAGPAPAAQARPKRQRKTGTFREIRTIRNRRGPGGKAYQWAYDVTYEDGRRIKSKSLGRVKP